MRGIFALLRQTTGKARATAIQNRRGCPICRQPTVKRVVILFGHGRKGRHEPGERRRTGPFVTDNQKQIDQFRNLIKTTMHSDAIALRRELDRLVTIPEKDGGRGDGPTPERSGAEIP